MNIADFRVQTSAPTTPASSVVGVYANASGTLVKVTSAGIVSSLGGEFTGSYPGNAAVAATGLSLTTGVYIGTAGSTGLAQPAVWIPVTLSNGSGYVIPGYQYR